MTLTEWFRTYFIRDSFEYVINKICSLSLKGQDTLPNKAELCRLKRELFNYFSQRLDALKSQKDPLDLKFGAIYASESLKLIGYMKKSNNEAVDILQSSLKTMEIVAPLARNNNPCDLSTLSAFYDNSTYKEDYYKCIKLINEHLSQYENN